MNNATGKSRQALQYIHTSMHRDGESIFVGKDEWGNEFTLTIPTYELLQWIDEESRKMMKKSLTKYIKEL